MRLPALRMGFYDLARVDREHIALANFKPAPVLRPKRCRCGKAVHAKVLIQQGMCDQCKLTDGIDANDLHKLRLVVGALPGINPKATWGVRNYFLAAGDDLHAMHRLMAAELVRAGAASPRGCLFHATRKGCRAAGLAPAAIQRALQADKESTMGKALTVWHSLSALAGAHD